MRKFKYSKDGFTLVELVVVIAVLAILSAVAIPSFICFPKKARATAALNSLTQVYKECLAKNLDNENQNFIPSNYSINGYSFKSKSNDFCEGDSSGLISIEPNDLDTYPVFNIAVVNGEMSYTYKGTSGSDFKEALAMLCMKGNNNRGQNNQNKYMQSFVMKNSFFSRECSDYVVVDGPKWSDAQANAIKLGGNLVTINDKDESEWIMDKYREIGENIDRDRWGARQLYIGLTRSSDTGDKTTNLGGRQDGWISGSNSTWRPPYWGEQEGGESDGNSSSIAFGQCGVEEGCWANWNDFPENRHDAKGIVEIPTCNN